MLILTRQPNQSLMIGDDIKITILECNRGNQIRFGIEAPKDIPVHREEFYLQIKEAGMPDLEPRYLPNGEPSVI